MKRRNGARDLAGKVAVITGAGSGIGRSLAMTLAGEGAEVAISDIDAMALEETAAGCKARGAVVRADRLDVTDSDAISAYAGDVRDHFGRVHQLYNNAGIAYFGEVEHQRLEDVQRILEVNLWGMLCATHAFLPHLIESGDGHVINMSSLFGLISFPGQSAYTTSKFAVRGFTETLRQEMLAAGHRVCVSCVHPGGIKTAIARSMTVAEGLDAAAIARVFDRRLALHSPDKAATAIVAGVRARKARIVVGAEAKALDRLARVTPAGSQRLGVLLARAIGLAPAPRSAGR